MSDTTEAKVDSGRQPGDPAGLPGFPRAGTPRVDSAQPKTGHRFLRRRARLAHRQRVHTDIGPTRRFLDGGLRLHPRAEVRDLAHVRTPLLNVELLEGTAPNQATNCHGCWTLVACAWRSTWKEIEAPDLPRLTGLSNIRRNQRFRRLGAGDQFIHLRTPIGMHLEFVTYPHGRHDHRDAAILTWNLVQPDDIARRALT